MAYAGIVAGHWIGKELLADRVAIREMKAQTKCEAKECRKAYAQDVGKISCSVMKRDVSSVHTMKVKSQVVAEIEKHTTKTTENGKSEKTKN